MSQGINANILHGWRKLARQGGAAIDVVQRDFVSVAIAPAPEVPAGDEHIEVELRRAAADLAAWTRELLRSLVFSAASTNAKFQRKPVVR